MNTLDYIFNEMNMSKKAIRRINKILASQGRLNKSLIFYSEIAIGLAAFSALESRKQKRQIKKLSEEVEELKAEREMNMHD